MTTQSPVQECLRCGSFEDTNLRLDCHHSICLVCLSYIAIKLESKLLTFPTSIDCPLCNQKTVLSGKAISMIKTTIENVLVPQFHETLNYSPSNLSYTSTLQRPIEQLPEPDSPQRLSFNQKLTGMTTTMNQSIDITVPTKSTGSYCSSPKLDSKEQRQMCKIHHLQQYMFCCSDCSNQFLCLKCFTDDHHSSHNIRSIKKTVELCMEQIGFSKVEMGQRVELLALAQKRLVNRKHLVEARLAISLEKVTNTFEQIYRKFRGKEQEVMKEINQHFGKIEDEIEMEIENMKYKIEETNDLLRKVKNVNGNESPLEFVKVYMELERELQDKESVSTLQLFQKLPSNKDPIELTSLSLNTLYHSITSLSLLFPLSHTQLRMDTVPSIRTQTHQKPFIITQKTDPDQQFSTNHSKTRLHMRLQQTRSNASPDQLSQIISRQFSCKNMFMRKEKEEFSITQNDVQQHSFASSKPMSKDSKERRERKTYGGYQMVEKQGKGQKSQFEKKLKKVINKNK